MTDDADDNLPTPSRRPRLTPANEERLVPVDAKSRESYEHAEAAVASKQALGVKLDEVLAIIPADGEEGAVPHEVLEMSDSTVHRLDVAFGPKKKPG